MTLAEIKKGLGEAATVAEDAASVALAVGVPGAADAAVTAIAHATQTSLTGQLTPTEASLLDFGEQLFEVVDPGAQVTQYANTIEEAVSLAVALIHKHHPGSIAVKHPGPLLTIRPVVTLSAAAALTHPVPVGSGSTAVTKSGGA